MTHTVPLQHAVQQWDVDIVCLTVPCRDEITVGDKMRNERSVPCVMGLRARGPIRGVRVVPALGTKPNQKSEKN